MDQWTDGRTDGRTDKAFYVIVLRVLLRLPKSKSRFPKTAQDYLTVPILDSFSNFFLTPSLNEAAMAKVFSIIPSMSFQEIPAAVKVSEKLIHMLNVAIVRR